MCYALTLPLICALQTVTRVFITALFAAEDLIRLLIHTVHSYLSSVIHLFSFVPICLAFCVAKQCFCSGSGCYPKSNTTCSCTIVIILTIIVILILHYTYWLEDLLGHIKVKLPCIIFRKTRNKETNTALRAGKTTNTDKVVNTSPLYHNVASNNTEQENLIEIVSENANNTFTEIQYLIPNEQDVDYFNLADNAIQDVLRNETKRTALIKVRNEHDWNNLTNYRIALRQR